MADEGSGRNQWSHFTVQDGMNHIGNVYNQKEEFRPSFFKTFDYEAAKAFNPPRVLGTCKWVLDNSKFVHWRDDSSSRVLWVSADPGCGKSVLSRALIDERLVLQAKSQLDEDTIIAYFFFKDIGEQSFSSTAICALLHQILCDDKAWKACLTVVKDFIVKQGERLQKEFAQLWRLLLQVVNKIGNTRVICVLDALDECRDADRKGLIDALKALQSNSSVDAATPPQLKVLVTSRPYQDIERWFRAAETEFPDIRLAGEDESDSISKEIDLFIDAKIVEFGNAFHLEERLRNLLRQKLLGNRHRTYLWLKFVLAELELLVDMSAQDVMLLLSNLPMTVREAYERILHRCPNQNLAKKMLSLVVVARRPLRIEELDILAGTSPDIHLRTKPDPESLRRRGKFIRHSCGLFLRVVDSKVYLIHQTAKDFLLRLKPVTDSTKLQALFMSEREAHCEMIRCCTDALIRSPCSDEYIRTVLQPLPVGCNVSPHSKNLNDSSQFPFEIDIIQSQNGLPVVAIETIRSLFQNELLSSNWSFQSIVYCAAYWYEHAIWLEPTEMGPVLERITHNCFDRQILWIISLFGMPSGLGQASGHGDLLTGLWYKQGLLQDKRDHEGNIKQILQPFSKPQLLLTLAVMRDYYGPRKLSNALRRKWFTMRH